MRDFRSTKAFSSRQRKNFSQQSNWIIFWLQLIINTSKAVFDIGDLLNIFFPPFDLGDLKQSEMKIEKKNSFSFEFFTSIQLEKSKHKSRAQR